jgi:hypothetical protein
MTTRTALLPSIITGTLALTSLFMVAPHSAQANYTNQGFVNTTACTDRFDSNCITKEWNASSGGGYPANQYPAYQAVFQYQPVTTNIGSLYNTGYQQPTYYTPSYYTPSYYDTSYYPSSYYTPSYSNSSYLDSYLNGYYGNSFSGYNNRGYNNSSNYLYSYNTPDTYQYQYSYSY